MTPATIPDLGEKIRAVAPSHGSVRFVCIDGPAASGKTTLGRLLADELGDAPIVHMDDLCEGWAGQGGAWERAEEWVLLPLTDGRPAHYRRFDWDAGQWAEWHTVPSADFVILEGVGSAPRRADAFAPYIIWVEAPAETRMRRGTQRDGELMRSTWEQWMVNEARDFDVEHTMQRANVRLSTADGGAQWWMIE